MGVFVDCYNAAAAEMESTDTNPKMSRSKLGQIFDDPESKMRLYICDVVTTTAFDLFIAFFICANVITVRMCSIRTASALVHSFSQSCLSSNGMDVCSVHTVTALVVCLTDACKFLENTKVCVIAPRLH